jgi:hypothetical protein
MYFVYHAIQSGPFKITYTFWFQDQVTSTILAAYIATIAAIRKMIVGLVTGLKAIVFVCIILYFL